MTEFVDGLAQNLTDAYNICDPVNALEGKALDSYYLPLLEARNTEAIIQVGQILQQQKPESFETILFTGHRGCGKSTELHRLEKHWHWFSLIKSGKNYWAKVRETKKQI
jgi:putative protein kinase ArgK-like GTPase of G3E family